MTERPLTLRPTRPGDTAVLRHDGGRPMTGRVVKAELDGAPLAIVAVDSGSPRADPITRARFAVRVLLMHRGQVISDAARRAGDRARAAS
jgi:hypothetical protein